MFRIRIQGLLDPDPDGGFWLDADSIEYGSETLKETISISDRILPDVLIRILVLPLIYIFELASQLF